MHLVEMEVDGVGMHVACVRQDSSGSLDGKRGGGLSSDVDRQCKEGGLVDT